MSILIKLRENKDFTENEEYIAKYIIKNFRNIRELDTNIISAKTYTSNASVIEILTKLSISALKETKLLQETEMINIVADLITKSDVLDFYGIGASHIVCLDAQYKFMRAGKTVNAFEEPDLQHVQAINSDRKHLAILVSYSGLTKEIIDIAEILQDKEIDTVSITGYGNNKLVKKCKYNLYVTSREALVRSAAIYSRISMLNLIDVIYFTYYNKNYDYVSDRIIKTKINKVQ